MNVLHFCPERRPMRTAAAAQRFLDMSDDVIVEPGEFEIRQLQEWRLRLRPTTLGLAGVVTLDVDEAATLAQGVSRQPRSGRSGAFALHSSCALALRYAFEP